jgi:NAD(P)-dependent dehydrogenase (short-subunit alcohol dehydrogenase family)
MQIDGSAAIVTGGASGLGGASAAALAEAGAKVAIIDIDAGAAEEAAARIGGLGLACDVRDGAAMEAAIATAREAHGAARILISCAGIGTPGRAVGRDGPLPLSAFESVIAVNLTGTFNAARLAAFDMQSLEPLDDGERGVIINTASVAAYDGQVGQPAYAASKGGIVAMTLPLAREFAQFGIRVMTIAPGIFETPMLAGLPQEVRESLAAEVPFPRRLGQPGEFARLALHIVESPMLNGETIRLDGAIRMKPR